jgi:hypothetical protein
LDKIIFSNIKDFSNGYREELYSMIIDQFSCFRCHLLPRSPKICSNKSCQAIFCKYCQIEVFKTLALCPNCCTPFKEEKNKKWIHQNLAQMYHMVNRLELTLKCKNHRDGCKFTQPLVEKMD